MKIASLPSNEQERLLALKKYNVLDTLPEKDFDQITRIASGICGTPISLVSLIDEDRQWFKSRHGLEAEQTHRDFAFCSHAIAEGEDLFMIPNALEDKRFEDNPLSVGHPNVVFYAGVPLVNPEGYALGTLCVIDHCPRTLTQDQIEALKALASQVVNQLELRKKVADLEHAQRELQETNKELNKFAYAASHDLKAPLNGIRALIELLRTGYSENMDTDGKLYLNLLENRSEKLGQVIGDILNHSRTTQNEHLEKEDFDLGELVHGVIDLLAPPPAFTFKYNGIFGTLNSFRFPLHQILQNLISNAIKYNDKEEPVIEIDFTCENGLYHFSVSDNGPGIPAEFHQKIFQAFQTLGVKDRFDKAGSGIGLATVRNLLKKMNGTAEVESEIGKGSTFHIYIPTGQAAENPSQKKGRNVA